MLVNDFLPTIVWEDVLKDVIPHHFKNTDVRRDPPQITYFDLAHEPTMPLEFSAAAYRFGHSMVRPGYRLSETVPPLAIFDPDPNASLTGFHEFRSNWAIDWGRLMDLGDFSISVTKIIRAILETANAFSWPTGSIPPWSIRWEICQIRRSPRPFL